MRIKLTTITKLKTGTATGTATKNYFPIFDALTKYHHETFFICTTYSYTFHFLLKS